MSESQPNFLVILVDQQRYPPPYETLEIQAFRKEHLKAQEALREQGVELHQHYAASAACVPSRASLLTGHYPSLHGVSQTDGVLKQTHDSDIFWLPPDTVPTMGDYFRAAGYRTFYKGKWHVSHADLEVNGKPFPTYDDHGVPQKEAIAAYEMANPLADYGFDGWIGPEPHGMAKSNTGTIRDACYANETIALLEHLEQEKNEQPWLIVSSYVNPHDIVLWGPTWWSFGFQKGDETVPDVPLPPTRYEDMSSKPRSQQSYLDAYPGIFPYQPSSEAYAQFYYYLHKLVDAEINRLYERLKSSRFFENTIVIFTSDHGELLGTHGGMQQKWHNAYEETTHVPMILSHPILFSGADLPNLLSNHVDLIPTMLGLAEVDVAAAQSELAKTHKMVVPLVGTDLSNILLGKETPPVEQAIYFMTDDEISEGQNLRFGKIKLEPIVQPCHVETVVAQKHTESGVERWKYSRYFDNPQFWSTPYVEDNRIHHGVLNITSTPEADQYELYDLINDRYEENNLANIADPNPSLQSTREWLEGLLQEQREQKRLYPVLRA